MEVRAGGTLPEQGVPLHWQGEAGTFALRLQLVMMQSGQAKRALAASLLLLVVLLVAWIVSLPGGAGLGAGVRPEQMALLGLLGWQTLGLNLVVVFVILLGVCARLIALVQVGVSLLRRWRPAVAAAGGEPDVSA